VLVGKLTATVFRAGGLKLAPDFEFTRFGREACYKRNRCLLIRWFRVAQFCRLYRLTLLVNSPNQVMLRITEIGEADALAKFARSGMSCGEGADFRNCAKRMNDPMKPYRFRRKRERREFR